MNPFLLPIILLENNTLVLNIIISIHKYMIDSNIKSIMPFEQVLKLLILANFLTVFQGLLVRVLTTKLGIYLMDKAFKKFFFMHLVSSHQNIFWTSLIVLSIFEIYFQFLNWKIDFYKPYFYRIFLTELLGH